MRLRIVIQARVGSSRLPGKILVPLAGRPLLAHVVRRLQAAEKWLELPLEVIVATTTDDADERTAQLCADLGAGCFRGARQDVLSRFVAAAEDLAEGDVLVRATADNPAYCPRRAGLIIRHHLAQQADYTCIRDLSYVVPEVMRVGALRRMARLAADAPNADYCREHVTPFFRQASALFRVTQLPPTWEGLRPDVRLTVDTQADYEIMAAICATLADPRGRIAGAMPELEDFYRQWHLLPAAHRQKRLASVIA